MVLPQPASETVMKAMVAALMMVFPDIVVSPNSKSDPRSMTPALAENKAEKGAGAVRVWDDAQVLATCQDKIVMARQGTLLASSFHPELTADRRVQEYFLTMVRQAAG